MATTQVTFDDESIDQHEGEQQCPSCKEWYERLSTHWQYSPEHRPSFTEKQREILIGSLLGDGSYDIQNNRFRWTNMIVRPYFEWLQEQFGVLTNTITVGESPKNLMKNLLERGMSTTIDSGKISQQFVLRTKTHPELSFCKKWGYSEDGFKSHFPENVSLTPTILKIWYMSDGSLSYNNRTFNCIQISNADQGHRTKYLTSLFNDIGFDVSVSSNEIRIARGQTEAFFDYIGDPPTGLDCGFKYKWAYDDYDEYRRLYKTMKAQPYWDRENECLVEQ